MNWVHVTERLAREFRLPGCFVLNADDNLWVGVQPPTAFREYLSGLFKTKEASYFNEIRFYKYSDEPVEGVPRFLALIPMTLKGVPYQFMGLLYESAEKLQELLRFRIMPNYTLFWLYQLVTEARVRNANQVGQKALIKALEEQRLYAARLEGKVENLHDEIRNVKSAELTLDQQIEKITGLLDRQMDEYTDLVDRYQDLFTDHQNIQEEYLETCVRMESRICELESNNAHSEAGPQDTGKQGEGAPEHTPQAADQEKSGNRIAALMERLSSSHTELARMSDQYKALKAEFGDISPGQVKLLVESMAEMRSRVDYYKGRCDEQEQRIKRMRAAALAERRGTKPSST